jgi:hypothetical protein
VAQVVVSVQNCGLTVVEQTVAVERETLLGDVRGAAVRYAGAPVRMSAIANRVHVGAQPLVLGQPRVIQERPVRVTVELVSTDGFGLAWPRFDPRMLVASAAVVLLAWWLEALGALVEQQPAPPVQHVAAPGIYIK